MIEGAYSGMLRNQQNTRVLLGKQDDKVLIVAFYGVKYDVCGTGADARICKGKR